MDKFSNYSREDLLWEATRRNEDYKKYFADRQKENSVDLEPLFTATGNDKWKMDKEVLDPSIDIDLIKKKISDGEDPLTTHPFYFLYNRITDSAFIHEIPRISTRSFKRDKKVTGEKKFKAVFTIDEGVKLRKFLLKSRGRIIISIDPCQDQEDVIEHIKKILPDERKRFKDITNKNSITINVGSIDYNIECLRGYDKIIAEFYKRKTPEEQIEIVDAVINKPKSINWTEIYDILVDGNVSADLQEYYSDRISKVYNKAVKLIRAAPNILFRPARIQYPKK